MNIDKRHKEGLKAVWEFFIILLTLVAAGTSVLGLLYLVAFHPWWFLGLAGPAALSWVYAAGYRGEW